MTDIKTIEKSIIKKYRKTIWSKFIKAIKDYELIKDNDKIAICISGGKDSMMLAKCFQELKRHNQINFSLEFITMNPGYNENNLKLIKDNAKILNIPLKIFETDIFSVINKHGGKSPCYLCARMRRGYLYDYAKKLGCNKIALAHHFDDIIETIMMNILYNGKYATMMPKLKSDNFIDMELIRPFYYIKEKDIILWSTYNNLEFIACGCPLSERKNTGKRKEVKEIIKALKATNENADINILKSSENINLNMAIKYYKNNIETSFLDEY